MKMKELYTEIDINAPPETVWRILTDFNRYPDWNPFIRSVSGNIEEGKRINVTLTTKNGRDMGFKPMVMKFSRNSEFRWLGKIPGFHGEHVFEIKTIGRNRVKFVQREEFTGFLTLIMGNKIVKDTRPGFQKMNRALKMLAENN
jgi:hypothetical protein